MNKKHLLFLLIISLFGLFFILTKTGKAQTALIPNFKCYNTWQSMATILEDWSAHYPNLLSVQTLAPSTTDNNQILALDLGIKRNESANHPHFVVVSGLRANDFASVQLNFRFAKILLEGYESNPDIHWLLNNVEINLILNANPDGRAVAEGQARDLPYPDYTLIDHFRNHAQYTCGSGFADVDLEQNFGSPTHPVTSCVDDHYSGPASQSESETKAIISYLEAKLSGSGLNSLDTLSDDVQNIFIHLSSAQPTTPELTENFPAGFLRSPFLTVGDEQQKTAINEWQKNLAYLAWDKDFSFAQTPLETSPIPGQPAEYVFEHYAIPTFGFQLRQNSDLNSPFVCSQFNEELIEARLSSLLNLASASIRPYQIANGPYLSNCSLSSAASAPSLLQVTCSFTGGKGNVFYTETPFSSIRASLDVAGFSDSYTLTDLQITHTSLGSGFTGEVSGSLLLPELADGRYLLTLRPEANNGTLGLPASSFITIKGAAPVITPTPIPTPKPDKYFLYCPIIAKGK